MDCSLQEGFNHAVVYLFVRPVGPLVRQLFDVWGKLQTQEVNQYGSLAGKAGGPRRILHL
jgi:hypothetical protein